MVPQKPSFGIVGMGVMGRNLALNIADRGIAVAGYDRNAHKVEALRTEGAGRPVTGTSSTQELVDALAAPRRILMMVGAGAPVEALIGDLAPRMQSGDLLIDGGNSHFRDTDRHAAELGKRGLHFIGVGISGGESGARHGASIMPGGPPEAYEMVRPAFEAVAAKVGGEPCVTWLGPGSAGHYVKMVHNGIEYALMQLISETYDIMKRGLALDNDRIADAYAQWNRGEAAGFLLEITAEVFRKVDENGAGRRLVDMIRDQAKQKGTGQWTAQDAMDLRVAVPGIDIAVGMRDLSATKGERVQAEAALPTPDRAIPAAERDGVFAALPQALYAAMILTYAQGMSQLAAASKIYEYGLDLSEVARIWRGGCIIRAALLEPIRAAFQAAPDGANLLLDPQLGRDALSRRPALLHVVAAAARAGIPAPGLMVSLAYFDAMRSGWLPANLIQAQRDYFGAHTYERIDAEGAFHTKWREK